jgi:hypothetical protein
LDALTSKNVFTPAPSVAIRYTATGPSITIRIDSVADNLRRQRDPKFKAAKLADAGVAAPRSLCEVCSFDFHGTYGGSIGEQRNN